MLTFFDIIMYKKRASQINQLALMRYQSVGFRCVVAYHKRCIINGLTLVA